MAATLILARKCKHYIAFGAVYFLRSEATERLDFDPGSNFSAMARDGLLQR